MKFKRLNEDIPEGIGLVCRQARGLIVPALFVAALFVPIAIAVRPLIPRFAQNAGRVDLVLMFMAAVCGLLILMIVPLSIRDFRLARRPTNWLLRIGADRLWINARAFDDQSAYDEPCVIELEYHEIAEARRDTDAYLVPKVGKRNREETNQIAALVFRLHEEPPAELATMLEANRLHVQPTKPGRLGITTHFEAARSPVTLLAPDEIRLAWEGGRSHVRPSLRRALKELRQYVAIGEPTFRDDTGADIGERVVQLVRAGEKMSAYKLLHERRGMTWEAAMKLVDEVEKQA